MKYNLFYVTMEILFHACYLGYTNIKWTNPSVAGINSYIKWYKSIRFLLHCTSDIKTAAPHAIKLIRFVDTRRGASDVTKQFSFLLH